MKKCLYIGLFFWLIFGCSKSTEKNAERNYSEVKNQNGLPTLFINNKQYPPFAYMSYLGETSNYKEVAEAGVHLYCFPAYLGERGINTSSGIGPFRSATWIAQNKYDFSSIKTDFEKIVEADPSAKIIMRLHLDPPVWWEELNPDACCHLSDGSTFRQCFSSEIWKEETGKALKDIVEWLLNSSYSKYLAGIHIAAGGTEEWVYHYKQYFEDENPVREEAFREWLKKYYSNDVSLLQKKWNDEKVDFKTATLGDISGKHKNEVWIDKNSGQQIIDTYQFHAETLADDIAYFCKIVKDVSIRQLLTGAFYGYHYFIPDARKGHGALGKLLECEDLDYLSSPNTYNRVAGEDWAPMAAIQSVQLHGKLWLAENDTRTSLTTLLKDRAPDITPPGQYESWVWKGPNDMETSESFLWKNAGRMLTQGYGGWWFDMWGGWFSDPRLLNVIQKTNEFYTSYPQEVGGLMKSEVCVIVDEQLCFYDASFGSLMRRILSNAFSLAKTGAPYDLFLRSDEEVIPKERYKIIWLMGFMDLSKEEKSMIKKWQEQGISLMWTDGTKTHLFKKNGNLKTEDKIKWTETSLNLLWKEAGVHLYTSPGDVFYIGHNWLCVHSVEGGEKNISFPFATKIIDPQKNEILSAGTRNYTLNMNSKSTVLLRLEPLNKKKL